MTINLGGAGLCGRIIVHGVADTRMIEASAGVCPASRSSGRFSDTYEPDAWVPRGDWRPLNESEVRDVIAPSELPFSRNSIAVIPLPRPLRRSIHEVDVVGRNKAWSDKDAVATRDELTRLSSPFVRSHLREDPLVDELGLVVNEPDDQTVTVNRRTGQRTGLHLDSWDRLSLDARGHATNRIGINLSHEHRWLLFCDVLVTTIVTQLADCPTKGSSLPGAFFAAYPDQPVYRVRIDAGHAYLAPTENMLHDGSTYGSSGPGAMLFFRGYFSV